MKLQHQVILSIGSNQGNRLGAINQCIEFIHRQLGTVLKISKIYQTPSWGFESDAFYNCALVMHTAHSAEFVLEKVLEIEAQVGRIRVDAQGYQARLIDIDLITFDNQIIDTEKLQIPHPLMQQRRFVLQPMIDLGVCWEHPILKKDLQQLLQDCPDPSVCEVVESADLFGITNGLGAKFISIEGNIGSGKTSLATRMAEDFNAQLVLEQFADNPFLDSFYQEPKKYAFLLEMSFLADRHQQFTSNLEALDASKQLLISDYHILKSLIFAKITLSEVSMRLYEQFFTLLHEAMPKPDLYVFLHQNTDRLLQNIHKRGRTYEQTIKADYLTKINQGYLDFINNQTELNVLVIDVSTLDFVNNQADYVFILEKIKACL